MASKTQSTATTGKPAATDGARSAPRDLAIKSPVGIPAGSSVPAYGGNRGGKPREDGLAPGSPEADAADKVKDAARKRDARAAARVAEPPPLPSAPANGVHTVAQASNGSSPLPGTAPGVQSDAVPWDPTALRPLLDELIEGTEQTRVERRRAKAVAVGLPDRVVKEVAAGSVYPGGAKRALALSGSSATAKVMNSLGVSGKYSDVAIALTALTAIVVSNKRSDAKLDEMIAEFKKAQAPKPATKP